jgi:ATP-dependent Lon protease
MADITFTADSFSGVARLFPVPKLVMFPHVLQPLHVFEPRYRALLSEAMADDQLIGMPVLAPGWEADYDGRPDLQPIACLGKVISHQATGGGRSNILLVGLHRIRLMDELASTKPFREASARLIDDVYSPSGDHQRDRIRRALLTAFKKKLSREVKSQDCLDELLRDDISLAVLTDIAAHTLDLAPSYKAQLLSEPDVDQRARWLLTKLQQTRRGKKPVTGNGFPPEFSLN